MPALYGESVYELAQVNVAAMRGDLDSLVVNLSVWRSYAELHAFVYRSAHGGFVRRRTRWFLATPQPSTALWWVTAGGPRPTVDEALARLRFLRRHGPTPRAFSVRRRFAPDGARIRQSSQAQGRVYEAD